MSLSLRTPTRPAPVRRAAMRAPLRRSPSLALAGVATALLLAGCATPRSGEIAPLPASPEQFAGWSCARIDDESEAVQRRAAEVAWAVDERAGNNILALGVGTMIFWPALFALRPHGPEADDLARLKGRHEALRQAAALASCPPPSLEMPAARAATMPVAVGDRLVYEERPNARRPVSETRWTVQALRRDEIEYAAPDGGAPLRHDRLGNVGAAAAGDLVWPHLLRGDLTLGQVMAGEIQIAGDPLARARVRAQVVAIGPQQVGDRQFEAVVLELFGDVPQGAGSTRLEGALVVDRKSGVLLRLDLRSAPPFELMRRLVRVQR